jgi:dTDP-glucose pyrophosphorylase
VYGKPMIQRVFENLNIKANFIFIVQKEHSEKYNLKTLFNLMSPGCYVIETLGLTEGAACTSLLATNLIENDNPLLIANSDQLVDWDSGDFLYSLNDIDGQILTFNDNNPKWSYADVENSFVTQVAEKKVISTHATCGIYGYSKGSDYVKYANQMISNNIRVNNEFYIAPIFNEFIKNNKKIKIKECKAMYGLGTPEDLEKFKQYNSSFLK